ncbi:hypothetical protein [Mycolicibacterium tusciae]|uniref:hypothetical protein n=1 Tax=Mycolicibacterium tusciae TaxID=75922 RepID=UPI00024A470B|nr:hypothetical protein [Mycolicibacterium tusciae]
MRLTRTAALTAAAVLGAVAPLVAPAPSRASTATVAAGDEIAVQSTRGPTVCTLGYTYTTGDTTYGVTAGHCTRGGGTTVVDLDSRAAGRVAVAITDPDPLFDDFALINFGTNRSVPTINGMPVSGMGVPDPRTTVCRSGIRTKTVCGQLDGRLLGYQYNVTGMPESVPGDSGAPVWQPASDGTATIVGIWLGEHHTHSGTRTGRFTSLTESLTELAVTGLQG